MTVPTATSRVRYNMSGGVTTYNFPWECLDPTHLKVVVRTVDNIEHVLTLNFDFFAFGIPTSGAGGGQIAIGAGAPFNVNGNVLSILRNEPATQMADYIANDPFPAAGHETALDKLTMLYARALERQDRSLLLRESDGLAGGQFQAMGNRISDLSDPVLDTDAATKGWVSILLAQYSAGIAAVITPGGAGVAQWNANKIQGRDVANTVPVDGYMLRWSNTNNRWDVVPAVDATTLLASNNTWAGSQIYNGLLTYNASATFNTAGSFLKFASTLHRIYGRFFGTPHSDRTLFQSNAAAQDSIIGVLPTAVGGSAGIGYYGNNDPDNASVLYIAAGPTSTLIQSSKTGTGVVQPIVIAADVTNAIRVAANARVQINTTTDNGAQLNVNGMITRDTAGASVQRNGVGFFVPDSVFTKLDWTVKDYDTKGFFDLVNDRFLPIGPPGYWIVKGSGGPNVPVAAGVRCHVSVFKNGVIWKTLTDVQGSGGTGLSSCGSCDVFLNGSTDYVELFAWQNSGGAQGWGGLTQDCYFQITHSG